MINRKSDIKIVPESTGQRGFTLVELMVVMAITVFVLAATSKILVSMISTMKQQSKIAETSIESVVGLEIMRRDIQSAGFGLPNGMSSGGMISLPMSLGQSCLHCDSS